jgi:hypothetical protein
MYSICDTNDTNEVRPRSPQNSHFFDVSFVQTALQVYCKNYKQAQVDNTHGLLRKAQRLDNILNTEDSVDSESSRAFPDPQCHRCRTEFSPSFYPTPPSTPPIKSTPSPGAQAWLCHRCHFEAEKKAHAGVNGTNGAVTNGVSSS